MRTPFFRDQEEGGGMNKEQGTKRKEKKIHEFYCMLFKHSVPFSFSTAFLSP